MEGATMDEPAVAMEPRDDAPAREDNADADVLRRVAAGDLAGFDTFVDRYKQRLFRHIHRRIRDLHRAEDLTQEVFLRLFRAARAGGYTGQARVVTWLFTI